MKKLTAFLLLFVTYVSFSQVPEFISYRAIAINTTTQAILSGKSIGIKISILEGSQTGSPIYVESHAVTTDPSGGYNLQIGGGTYLPATGTTPFNLINWGSGSKFLRIDMDINAGTNYNQYVGVTPLLSVPFAFLAKDVLNGIQTINNIADLRTNNSYVNNKVVYIKGYYTPGDGGEGFFIYKSTETQGDNNGIIIKPAAVVATNPGRWVRQYSGYINASYFGVIRDFLPTGFSNSDRIQQIIDYIYLNNYYSTQSDMTVYFPNGQYFIDKPLILKDKGMLRGSPGTLFTVNPGSTYDYMFKLDSGAVTNFQMDTFTINLNGNIGIGGMLIKGNGSPNGGLWTSTLKNISIINLKGNGIYLEGSNNAANYSLPNQNLLFENIRITRQDANYNALKLTGQQNACTFLNCSFDSYVGSNIKGVNVLISGTDTNEEGSAVLSFINCAIGGATEYGVLMNKSQNVTFDSCYFEDLDLSLDIRNSLQVNILNCRFANAAGMGSDQHPSHIPANTGRCITSENSFITVENNFVIVTDPSLPAAQGEKFIVGLGNNNVINARNNTFQDPRLGETAGILQTISIVSNTIDLWSKKLVYVTVPATYNMATSDIKAIKSDINAGETIFIRANGGPIKFLAVDPTNLLSGIFLNGRASLTLTNGQAATFIKIDGLGADLKAVYQLVSIAN